MPVKGMIFDVFALMIAFSPGMYASLSVRIEIIGGAAFCGGTNAFSPIANCAVEVALPYFTDTV